MSQTNKNSAPLSDSSCNGIILWNYLTSLPILVIIMCHTIKRTRQSYCHGYMMADSQLHVTTTRCRCLFLFVCCPHCGRGPSVNLRSHSCRHKLSENNYCDNICSKKEIEKPPFFCSYHFITNIIYYHWFSLSFSLIQRQRERSGD